MTLYPNQAVAIAVEVGANVCVAGINLTRRKEPAIRLALLMTSTFVHPHRNTVAEEKETLLFKVILDIPQVKEKVEIARTDLSKLRCRSV